MIWGESPTFREINRVVETLEAERARDESRAPRRILVNAHQRLEDGPIPRDFAVIYNFENPCGLGHRRNCWQACEVWDFDRVHAERYNAVHVPVGYHPAWQSFEQVPRAQRNIDVSFFGTLDDTRSQIRAELVSGGTRTAIGIPSPPEERDEILSRTRVGFTTMYYPDGAFPALRVAHLLAGGIPVIAEKSRDAWPFLKLVTRDAMVSSLRAWVILDDAELEAIAREQLDAFRRMPFVLPITSPATAWRGPS